MLTVLLFIVVTGYFYNFYPLQLKNRPFWGIILNSLMGWLAFTLGWLIIDELSVSFIVKSMPYIFHNAALCLLTTIPDEDGDKSTGKLTFCVRFGKKKTILISGLFCLISLILSFILMDQFILTLNLVILYWVVYMVLYRTISSAIKTIKMAIFFFSLLICLKFPSYLLLMITIFYLCKYYYKIRFDFDYPNFRGE
jgi:1,4-dihydroxy-2-naphthoate octaprenyltransferase